MSTTIAIECPVCRRRTTLTGLKFLNDEESKEDLEKFSRRTDDLITPKFDKWQYQRYLKNVSTENTISITISKIGAHRIGLFKEYCIYSNKMFKVALYTFMDHEKKTAGFTFRIGDEIYYY